VLTQPFVVVSDGHMEKTSEGAEYSETERLELFDCGLEDTAEEVGFPLTSALPVLVNFHDDLGGMT